MTLESTLEQILQNWPTVAGSLVVGLLSGFGGSLVGARVNLRIAASSRRESARVALWGFQRVLRDFSFEDESRVVQDGTLAFTATTHKDLADRRAEAYPYATYLPADQRHLIFQNFIEDAPPGGNPLVVSNAIWERAQQLGEILQEVITDKHK